jgi:hypothetical protein
MVVNALHAAKLSSLAQACRQHCLLLQSSSVQSDSSPCTLCGSTSSSLWRHTGKERKCNICYCAGQRARRKVRTAVPHSSPACMIWPKIASVQALAEALQQAAARAQEQGLEDEAKAGGRRSARIAERQSACAPPPQQCQQEAPAQAPCTVHPGVAPVCVRRKRAAWVACPAPTPAALGSEASTSATTVAAGAALQPAEQDPNWGLLLLCTAAETMERAVKRARLDGSCGPGG